MFWVVDKTFYQKQLERKGRDYDDLERNYNRLRRRLNQGESPMPSSTDQTQVPAFLKEKLSGAAANSQEVTERPAPDAVYPPKPPRLEHIPGQEASLAYAGAAETAAAMAEKLCADIDKTIAILEDHKRAVRETAAKISKVYVEQGQRVQAEIDRHAEVIATVHKTYAIFEDMLQSPKPTEPAKPAEPAA